jgi:hypothetical protein
MLQVTPAFAGSPCTCTVNCWDKPSGTTAVVGDKPIETFGGSTVITAVADLVGSATDVAIIGIAGTCGTTKGAVYCPVELTVPQTAGVQTTFAGFPTFHVTPILEGSF